MQSSRLLLVLLVFLATIQCSALADRKATLDIESDDSDDESSAVELNLDYVGDNDGDNKGLDSDSDTDADEASTKSVLSKAIGKSGKPKSKVMPLIKKQRVKITVVLALFAFRREIFSVMLNQLSVTSTDPGTGKTTRQLRIRCGPTEIIKIFLFIDVMRQLQGTGKKKSSPLLAALVLLGIRYPFLGSFISKLLLSENPTFVPPVEQHFTFERVNERYRKDCMAIQKASYSHKSTNTPSLTSILHPEDMSKKQYEETVIILDLHNVERAGPGFNRIDSLRDEVSFLLHQHQARTIMPYGTGGGSNSTGTDELEVLIVLESPGGSAQEFALASQQILRLRNEPGITVTICVDKVAASGGYMIACCASAGRLLAAPFAIVGSIGVVGQMVNIQKMLEGYGVQPYVFRGGKDKAPAGLLGNVNRDDLARVQVMVDDVHRAFKQHVAEARPALKSKIDKLATGRIWLGYDAIDVGLIDKITTSDEYIGERINDGARILRLLKNYRRRFSLAPPHPNNPSYSGANSEGQQRLTGASLLDPILAYARNVWSMLVGQSNAGLEQLLAPLPSTRTAGSCGLKASAVELAAAASASTQ